MTTAPTHTEDSVTGLGADGRATLLLCGHFGLRPGTVKPLTPAEYHALADCLEQRSLTPASLLHREGLRNLDARVRGQTAPARLAQLLDRGSDLDAALGRLLELDAIWNATSDEIADLALGKV